MYNFKGKVKIEEIKEELESLVNAINNMIDDLSNIPTVDTIDYTIGGATLAPSGSTLTVGGLRQALQAMNGTIIGCKVCMGEATEDIKISDGLLFTSTGVIRLPNHEEYINGSESLYYNRVTGSYQLYFDPDQEHALVKICDFNNNRPSRFISDNRQIEVEDFPGSYELKVENRTFGNDSLNTSFYPEDRTKPYFFSAIEAPTPLAQPLNNAVNLFSQNISFNGAPYNREVNYWTGASSLYIPKGISPRGLFTFRGKDVSKTFNVIVDKKVDY